MPSSFTRRALLSSVTGALAGGLVGCTTTSPAETGESVVDGTWELRSCPAEYGYDRDGAVVIREGELSLWANQCDAIAVGDELPVVVDPKKGCD